VLEVYAAREAPIPGVGGEQLVETARRAGASPGQIVFAAGAEQAIADITAVARPGDLCLVLGAGDVWKAARAIHATLSGRDGDVEAR
jgi:UDP-N-acetylmuramate--alanine ligase